MRFLGRSSLRFGPPFLVVRLSRSLFKYKFRKRVLPTFTIESMKAFRWVLTHKLSVFIGRTLPGVGWVLMARMLLRLATRRC